MGSLTSVTAMLVSSIVFFCFGVPRTSNAAPARLGPGQVAIAIRGHADGRATAELTDGQVLMAFTIGDRMGVKDCQLSFDSADSKRLLSEDNLKIELFGKSAIADLVDACNKISMFGGVEGIGTEITLPQEILGSTSTYSTSKGIVVPGTKWCGMGQTAENDDDLGSIADVDSCCRAHDKCPYNVHAFQTKDFYFNLRPHTVSTCDCDESFFNCLKGVKENKTVADSMGSAYFNTVGPPCVKKEVGKYCANWHWTNMWCVETGEGMAAIGYSYLDGSWKLADSVKALLDSLDAKPTPIPPK